MCWIFSWLHLKQILGFRAPCCLHNCKLCAFSLFWMFLMICKSSPRFVVDLIRASNRVFFLAWIARVNSLLIKSCYNFLCLCGSYVFFSIILFASILERWGRNFLEKYFGEHVTYFISYAFVVFVLISIDFQDIYIFGSSPFNCPTLFHA